jgi:uncharacterized protein YegL
LLTREDIVKKTYVYRLPADAEALEREHGMTKPDGWVGEVTIVDDDRSGKSVVVEPVSNDKDMFITCVIDRSGSMESVIGDAIGGLNAFIAEQKKDTRKHGGTTRISFIMFDDYIERPYTNADLSTVVPFTKDTYVPRGSTALYDAIGTAVSETEAIGDLPRKVMFMILTDGHENASTKMTKDNIKALVEKKRGADGWAFAFLQADLDAMDAGNIAQGIGVAAGSTRAYRSADQTGAVYAAAAQSANAFRAGYAESDALFSGDPNAATAMEDDEPAEKAKPKGKHTKTTSQST